MNKIVEIKFGSHLYGTDTPESDLDYKGIYLPTAREIVLGNYKDTISTSRKKKLNERNTKEDIDREIFSLDRFLGLLTQGQTVALDILFCNPSDIVSITDQGSEVMYQIYVNKDKLLTRNINAFTGYAKQQAAKYGIKGSRLDALTRTVTLLESFNQSDKLERYADQLYNLEEQCKSFVSLEKTPLVSIVWHQSTTKDHQVQHLLVNGKLCPFAAKVKVATGIYKKIMNAYGSRAHKAHLSGGKDWKALSHAVRVNHEALELLTTGKITFPRPERELLLKIKTEQMPYEEVAELIEKGLAEVHEAHKTSTLRDTPDQEWVSDFIHSVYSDIVKKS